MKCIILAGGVGSRLFEETRVKPKPLVKIANNPIILLIIFFLKKFGIKEIFVCLGYKGKLIEKYFLNYAKEKKNKYQFNKKKKIINFFTGKLKNISINFCDTGLNTGTGGRLLKIKKKFKKDENFFMVYGDGISDVNLFKLKSIHIKNKKIVTMTVVKPKNRFGLAFCKGDRLLSFNERKMHEKNSKNWINAGIFCLNYKVFNYIKNFETYFEHQPIQTLIKKRKISVFKHSRFWTCIDTLKDKIELERRWKLKENWTKKFK